MSVPPVILIAVVLLSGVQHADQRAEPPRKMQIELGQRAIMDMVLIQPGEFGMGSLQAESGLHAAQRPQHRVRITKPFYMGVTEVTQGQWRAVMGKNPSYFEGSDQLPVENVSWEDCQLFIARLNQMVAGGGFRLPTEAEWEYACRAGTTTRFSFGDDEAELAQYAWYAGNSETRTHEVATKKPNPWELYDMHGNVRQWCQDWYAEDYYAMSPSDDPQGPPARGDLPQRVVRGGSWIQFASNCRSVFRSSARPKEIDSDLGIRLVRTAESP
jgi:formylglycine-generating enzyme required for sulfatase activity